jgi:exopolysaccharide biosynthesis WecB/TagA/CpsF family protein
MNIDSKTIHTQFCDFHDLSMTESVSKVVELSRSKDAEIIVTPNIDHLARLTKPGSEELSVIYQSASLILCDSKILHKLLLFKGMHINHVIPGSSLTEELFSNSLSEKDNITIIGGDNSVITKLRNKHPDLTINHYNPPMGFINKPDEVQKTIDFCVQHNGHYTFLAVGSPRQEILAAKLAEQDSVQGAILCIGASILFLVDEEKRAPLWMQTLHLEWLYRMLQDPKRLAKRYGSNFLKLPAIYRNL